MRNVNGVECDKHKRNQPSDYRWKVRFHHECIDTLKQEVTCIDDVDKYDTPDDMVMCISKAIQTAGEKMQCVFNKKMTSQSEWFDNNNECVRLKAMKYQNLRRFRSTGRMDDLQKYKQSKEIFKQTCKLKKEEFKKSVCNKLLYLTNNPTKFWKYLISIQTSKTISKNSISADHWFNISSLCLKLCR